MSIEIKIIVNQKLVSEVKKQRINPTTKDERFIDWYRRMEMCTHNWNSKTLFCDGMDHENGLDYYHVSLYSLDKLNSYAGNHFNAGFLNCNNPWR